MSGAYDLALIVECRTFKDVAIFVQQRLASLDSVMSTATHFVLVRYKEKGTAVSYTHLDVYKRQRPGEPVVSKLDWRDQAGIGVTGTHDTVST